MFLHIDTFNEVTKKKVTDSETLFHHTNTHFTGISPVGEHTMTKIITRLTELSDALQKVSLHSEAVVVQSHIDRLSSVEYNDLLANQGLESVISDLVADFT
jgi:hypothetical protein